MWLADKAKDVQAWCKEVFNDLSGKTLKAVRDPAVKADRAMRSGMKAVIGIGTAVLVTLGILAVPSLSTPSAGESRTGAACLFSAPDGAANAGHIGWGMQVGPGDLWHYGATEGVAGGTPWHVNPRDENGAWDHTGTKTQMLADFANGGWGPKKGNTNYYTQYRCEQPVHSSTIQIAHAEGLVGTAKGAGYDLIGNNCLDRSIMELKAYGADPADITGPLEPSPYVYFNSALDPTHWGQINDVPRVLGDSTGPSSGGAVGGGAVGNPQDLPNVALPNVAAPIPAPAPAPPSIEGTWTLSRKLQSCQNLNEGCSSAPFTVRIDCSGSSSCSIGRTDGLWHSAHPLTSDGSTWTASFTDVGVTCRGQYNDASFSWTLTMEGSELQGEYSYTTDTNPPDCDSNPLASFLVTGSR